MIGVPASPWPSCSREELDRHYFIRGRLPEWDAALAEFATRSARCRKRAADAALDLAYGSDPRQRLDIFPASADAVPAPVMIFVHGGYWRMLDKSDFSFSADGLRPHGIMTVVLNYRLLPAFTLAEIIADVRAAVRWLRIHVGTYGGNIERLFICGHSAGAQLAAHAIASAAGTAIRGFVGLSGVYDLCPVRACFLNDIAFLDEAALTAFAAHKAVPGHPCPARILWGDSEGAEFTRQSREQAAWWMAEGYATTARPLPGRNHATIVGELGDPGSDVVKEVTDLIYAEDIRQ